MILLAWKSWKSFPTPPTTELMSKNTMERIYTGLTAVYFATEVCSNIPPPEARNPACRELASIRNNVNFRSRLIILSDEETEVLASFRYCFISI
jgi:hypothetical protein